MQLHHASWNFSTAGRRKSFSEGTGGTVKVLCDRAVAYGNDVTSAQNMMNVIINSRNSKINIFLVTENQIKKIDELIIKDLKAAPKSMKIHQLICKNTERNILYLNYLSCTDCLSFPPCIHYALNPCKYSTEPISMIAREAQTPQKSPKIRD